MGAAQKRAGIPLLRKLRPYQKELISIALSLPGNVLIQADTGAGKTQVLAAIAKSTPRVLIVAHRNELVAQLSLEFAKAGLVHGMLCAKSTTRRAEALQHRTLGKSMISEKTTRFICSIDTLVSRHQRDALAFDASNAWLVIVDEAHHLHEENKWGRLCHIFSKCRIIGATATPCRLDGVSLKRGMGGVFDTLIQAESLQRESVSTLIRWGYLSAFKCYSPECRINEGNLRKKNCDYTPSSLAKETGKHIQEMAGDAIEYYKKLAFNKQAVAFCVSISAAIETAAAFRASGVASAAIHSKMSKCEVNKILDLFESSQIQVIFNVDVLGEGIDIPAIEALLMLRKTASLTLYRQWVGRALRPCTGKEYAIIIDHADNVRQHGLPDMHISWCLDQPPCEQKTNLVPCKRCRFLVNAWIEFCPECGEKLRSETGFSDRDVRYIDVPLVESHRTLLAKKSYDNTPASGIPPSEIRYLNAYGGKLADLTTQVATWFFHNIKNQITRAEAEAFFLENNNIPFWSTHFNLADLSTGQSVRNEKKCMKVFYEATGRLR